MTAENLDLLCFGEILYDDYGDRRVLAGAPLNTASVDSALGLKAAIASAVGKGDAAAIRKELESRGIAHYIQEREQPTGRAAITLSNGVPDFRFDDDSAFDYIGATDELVKAAANAKFFYFGTLAQRKEVTRRTLLSILPKVKGAVIYDVNFRKGIPDLDAIVRDSVRHVDILKVNGEELELLKGIYNVSDVAKRLFSATKLQHIFVTMGRKGARLYQRGSAEIYAAAPEVSAVDTTGSGDAFTAAVVYGISRKLPMERVLQFAVSASSSAAKYGGAFSDELRNELTSLKA